MSDGPVEGFNWPKRLTARRVTVDGPPRLDGYDIRGDLAPNYTPSALLFCGLTGELPANDVRMRAFDVALMWWAPVTIAEAPAHAASLAMLTRTSTSSVLATGAVVLAEQVRDVLDRHSALLEWLADPTGPVPADVLTTSTDETEAVRMLEAQVEVELVTTGYDVTLEAALLGLLHTLGLTNRAQIESAIMWARLPCVWAEALAVKPADFRNYPMNVPVFTYEGSDDID